MYRKNKAIFNGCYTNSLFYDMKLCLHDTGDEKLPKMDALKKQRRELADKKKALYAEYRQAQRDMREAVAVKANIDHLLGLTDGRTDKEQTR